MNNAEYKKEWKRRNKERERLNNKRWYEENKTFVAQRKAKFYLDHLEEEKSRTSKWKKNNKNKINNLLKSNPSRRISQLIRSKICKLLSGKQKTSKTIDYLGCSFDDFIKHIEKQFLPNMNWSNYGLRGWHLDHIKPLALFDLTKDDEIRKAWHYTNLRPLWAKDNLAKGKKYCV